MTTLPAAQVLKPKIREIDIQRAVCDLLRIDGWRYLRTDPLSDKSRGKGFGEIGMADALFLRYEEFGWGSARTMWVEFKRPGGKPTQAQQDWHALERAHGALTVLMGEDCEPTYDGFRAWYLASGLNRRIK